MTNYENKVKSYTQLVFKYLLRLSAEAKLIIIIGLIIMTNVATVLAAPVNNLSTAKSQQPYVDPSLKFVINQTRPIIGYTEQKVEIKVDESNSERQARLQREAQAAAQAVAKRTVVTREAPNRSEGPSFEEKRTLVQQIANTHSIDWKILEAVWQVETGKSWDGQVVSSAGAQGPMQFMPSTFRKYAAPGASIISATDSLNAGASLLAQAGAAAGNIDAALYSYNHSSAYVTKVKQIAASIQQ